MKPIHLAVGRLNIDVVVKADKVPDPDVPTYTDLLEILPGGAATNYAVAVNRLGHEVKLLAKVSRSPLVKVMMGLLAQEGIGLDYVQELDGSPSIALIFLRDDGRISMIRKLGVSASLSQDDIKPLFGLFDVIHFASVRSDIVLRDPNAGLVSYDPGPTASNLTSVPDVDVMYLNEAEYEAVKDKLSKVRYVVVKRGSKGAEVLSEKERCVGKALKVKPVDTTGAGDVFDAAFNFALMEGMSLEDSLRFAITASGMKVERLGGTSSPTLEEVVKRMKSENVEVTCT